MLTFVSCYYFVVKMPAATVSFLSVLQLAPNQASAAPLSLLSSLPRDKRRHHKFVKGWLRGSGPSPWAG